jgi:hypothetical protein
VRVVAEKDVAWISAVARAIDERGDIPRVRSDWLVPRRDQGRVVSRVDDCLHDPYCNRGLEKVMRDSTYGPRPREPEHRGEP